MEELKPITDDSYRPYPSEGAKYIQNRSPKPIEELKKFSDEELLSFLNEWDNPHHDPDDWAIEISFEGLSQAFQSIFKDQIIPDDSRLKFWIDNQYRLERPIYVETMVCTIHELVNSKEFDKLDLWFDFCEGILNNPDHRKAETVNQNEESLAHPDWYPDWQSVRRTVGDFVGMCLKEEVNVPISARLRLASLLDMLCTQYDRGLDDDEPVILNRDDQLEEAFQHTRGRALDHLVDFGLWVRRHTMAEADVPEVKAILEKRFNSEAKYPVTLPEHAMLGRLYRWIFFLDQTLGHQSRKSTFFPQNDMAAWREAFG